MSRLSHPTLASTLTLVLVAANLAACAGPAGGGSGYHSSPPPTNAVSPGGGGATYAESGTTSAPSYEESGSGSSGDESSYAAPVTVAPASPVPGVTGSYDKSAASEAKPSVAKPPVFITASPVSTSTSTPTMPAPPAPPTITGTATVTTTVTVTTPVIPQIIPQPVYPDDPGSPTGGILTAAIWDDNAIRGQFETFLARYPSFKESWSVDLSRRVVIRVEDSKGVAVGDAPVALRAPDGEVIQLRTHADGTTVFFPTSKMVASTAIANQQQQQQPQGGFNAAAQVGTLRTETSFAIPKAGDTAWTIKLTGIPIRAQLPAVDVAFVVDTTGSMGDEISYLQAELVGVVQRVKKEQSLRRVRLALVLYKDRGDEYVTKTYPFTEDLTTFLNELKTAGAGGGGDMPESVNAALHESVEGLAWAGDESARLAFLVGDAPPHYYADEQYTYKDAAWDLSARGVKLVPVAASGIDKSTEYVFRELAAFTGGRYIFLTDDSGVGESHLVPDITGYQVEHLDRILVRAIRDEANAFKR